MKNLLTLLFAFALSWIVAIGGMLYYSLKCGVILIVTLLDNLLNAIESAIRADINRQIEARKYDPFYLEPWYEEKYSPKKFNSWK